MKKISSNITWLYRSVWPVFSVIIFVFMSILMFKIPMLILLNMVYFVVSIWVGILFVQLKDVWIDKGGMTLQNGNGEKTNVEKGSILEIKQNPTMITPRLVIIKYMTVGGDIKIFRFIPEWGHSVFWRHKIVDKLNEWRYGD